MIVRILEDGQYEVGKEAEIRLHEIDEKLSKALDKGDDDAFDAALANLVKHVHEKGKRLKSDELRPSDRAVPAAGSTLSEVKALLGSESSTKD